MGWEGWVTIGSVVMMFVFLVGTRIGPEFIVMGVLTLLVTIGIVSPTEALVGLSNQGMVTVAILFVVAAGARETGAIAILTPFLNKRPKTITRAQARLMLPVTTLSAFLNNTPVVAIFIPAVTTWAKKFGMPVSKLMIPLSYAAILGGTCTLIGTSTNLVVNGLMIDETGSDGLGMFEIAKVGLPCAAFMMIFVFAVSRWFLPNRSSMMGKVDQPKEYTVEMTIRPGSNLDGKTLTQAGLKELDDMQLLSVVRAGQVLSDFDPSTPLAAGDRLVFAGILDTVAELQKVRGLTPATNDIDKIKTPRSDRCLMEAVVSRSCRLLGQVIGEDHFRKTYAAAVIGISREGRRIEQSIADSKLQAGDSLLIEAAPSFRLRHRHSRDFFLISQLDDSSPPRFTKAWLAFGILLGMIALASSGVMGMLNAAAIAAALLLMTRCLTTAQAMRSVDWQVLLVIVAAFGIGKAMQITGAAAAIAHSLTGLVGDNPWAVLMVIYALTSLFTEVITNNAGALLMFPIALSVSQQMGVNMMPFTIAIMMGASASFATPIGYQTNMMVYGPGGYRFADYLKIGVPMNVLMCLVASALIPFIWPF